VTIRTATLPIGVTTPKRDSISALDLHGNETSDSIRHWENGVGYLVGLLVKESCYDISASYQFSPRREP
jgi:hypothetical protein